MALLEANNVVKEYKTKSGVVRALQGLSLSVPQGIIQGVLGPNGAGKSTLVKIATTLERPTSGTVNVMGFDVATQGHEVRKRVGVSAQNSTVDENLTAFENLEVIGRLYRLGGTLARARATELIEAFGLQEAAHRPLRGFSGGMRRRLDLAASLVINPALLFLDEPTTGLDPKSRLALWDVIRDRAAQGTTVLLTTQYLEEAEHLASDIVVVDHGKIIAQGNADQLKAKVGGYNVQIIVEHAEDAQAAFDLLAGHGNHQPVIDPNGRTISVPVQNGLASLEHVTSELRQAPFAVMDVGIRRPTLDEVFLALTGQSPEQVDINPADQRPRRRGRAAMR